MTSVAGSSLSALFNPAQISSQLISTGDQNGDAALSFSEVSNLWETGSSEATTGSTGSQQITDLFNAIDTDSNGSLTKSELTEFSQKLSDNITAIMLQMQEESGSAGANQMAGGSTSSQSNSYDPLDTNKDGIVSLMEKLAATQSEQIGTTSKNNQSRSTMAINSYQTTSSSIASAATSTALSLTV